MAGREYRVTVGTVSGLPLSGSAADGVAATDVASWQMDGVRTALVCVAPAESASPTGSAAVRTMSIWSEIASVNPTGSDGVVV